MSRWLSHARQQQTYTAIICPFDRATWDTAACINRAASDWVTVLISSGMWIIAVLKRCNSVVCPGRRHCRFFGCPCKKALPSGVVRAIPSTGWWHLRLFPLKVKQFFVLAAWLLAFQIIGPRTWKIRSLMLLANRGLVNVLWTSRAAPKPSKAQWL